MALTLPPEPKKQMLVDKIRGQLSDADRKLLDEWIADRSISTQRITDALCDEGFQVSKAAVDHWRARYRDAR